METYYKQALIHLINHKLDDDEVEKLSKEMYSQVFNQSLDERLCELQDDYAQGGEIVTEIGTINIVSLDDDEQDTGSAKWEIMK